jgi:hypothetical protein
MNQSKFNDLYQTLTEMLPLKPAAPVAPQQQNTAQPQLSSQPQQQVQPQQQPNNQTGTDPAQIQQIVQAVLQAIQKK